MIKKENIRAKVQADDWRDAIKKVGALLVEAKSVIPDYLDAMIKAIEDMGPYIVLMPGFALAHAAPSEAVLQNDAALITLKEGINFGSANDPVYVVFCVSCKDRESHRSMLKKIAKRFLDEGVLEEIMNAQSVDGIAACLQE